MVVGLIAGGAAALTRAVEGAEDNPQQGADDISNLGVQESDLVVGIATSGRTPYVLGAVREARRRGARTIGLTCNRPSLLGSEVDLEIAPLVGAEVIAGSTRLKAGTATKMILNMISTGAMVQIGKTLGNRMVDLMPSNEKLRIRSRRILRELTGVDDAAATQILSQCDGHLKRALVVALTGADPDKAQTLLDAVGGQVRSAVKAADRERATMTLPAAYPSIRLLGIDGGGTTTKAWLAEPGCRVLGQGTAGPSNAKSVGLEAARWALNTAIHRAFHAAGLTPHSVNSICLGLAGLDRPDDRKILGEWAEEACWAHKILLVNDGDLVIAAGTPEGWGIGVIAGTGSIAVGRTKDGRTARAGGWGHLIGDEGSAATASRLTP